MFFGSDGVAPRLVHFPFGGEFAANFHFLDRPNLSQAHSVSWKPTTSLPELWLLELTVHEDDADQL